VSTKHFEMAVKAIEQEPDEDDFITFDFPDANYDDGRSPEFKAYRPLPSQFAIAMSAIGPRRDLGTKLAGIVDFMVEVLDDEGQSYVTNRLLDRRDTFGLDELQQLMEWMIEEWSARPTERPSGSTRSASRGGPKSRRPTTRKTSSASA